MIKSAMIEEKNFKKYFFWAFLAILALISYYIIQDYLVAIISAFIIAYLLVPIHKRFSKTLGKTASALILILGFLAILLVSIYFISSSLINQGATYLTQENLDGIVSSFSDYLAKLNISDKFLSYLPTLLEKIGVAIIPVVYSWIAYLPSLAFTIGLTLFIAYFLLVSWEDIGKALKEIIPFKDKEFTVKKLSESSNHIVYGLFLIAILEFLVALIGLYFAGVNLYILFAFLIAVLGIFPFIGPYLIWIPLMIVSIIQADYVSAGIILAMGLIISILIDDVIKPLVIGKATKIHSVILLIGILGGVELFGIFGLIIGPLLLSFMIDFIRAGMKE